MASFNKVIMMGNLTRDPEYKPQVSGQGGVCKLSIASNRQFKNKQTGALVQEVCYIDVDTWGQLAENCRQYLQKGRPVLVEGRLKLDTWEAEGQSRRKHVIVADKVVFLGANAGDSNFADNSDFNKPERSNTDFGMQMKDEPPFDQDLPF